MLKFILTSFFLVAFLIASITASNFSAYGHYDAPTSAEKVRVIIDKLELVPNAKCLECNEEYVDYENLDFFWRVDSTYHDEHSAGGTYFHKKSYAKSEYNEYLPALNEKGITVKIVPHFKKEHKISQTIWTHTDCKDAENVDVYFELVNPGNPTIKGLTGVTDLISTLNKPNKYGKWVADGIPKVPLPPVIKYGAKLAKELNKDEFLGGTKFTAGPGSYVTEIRTPISEEQHATYMRDLKNFGEKNAAKYLDMVSQHVAKIHWRYVVDDLPKDSSCIPKTSTIVPTTPAKTSTSIPTTPTKPTTGLKIDSEKTAKTMTEPKEKKKAMPTPLIKKSTTKTEKESSTGSSNMLPSDSKPTTTNTKPQMTIPKQMIREAASSSGAIVNYDVSAQDKEDGAITPSCDRPSGSQFPMGDTTVSCTAKDSTGNSVQGSFTITVRDTTPPTIDAIQPTEGARDDSGVVIYFTVNAHDAVDGTVTASCNYASGTKFPIGVTVLTCTADDSKGNHASRSLQITITMKESAQ